MKIKPSLRTNGSQLIRSKERMTLFVKERYKNEMTSVPNNISVRAEMAFSKITGVVKNRKGINQFCCKLSFCAIFNSIPACAKMSIKLKARTALKPSWAIG